MANKEGFEEYSELVSLGTSSGWRKYIAILERRKEFLQKEINRFVREQKLFEAYGTLSKMDDLNKIVNSLSQKVEELKGEK